MSFEMRAACESCGAALMQDRVAFICSYECTFCGVCAAKMGYSCPNCGGELVRRPKRRLTSGESEG